jgi:acetate CoA/acetoacetate CoA-transferase beta subunit
VPHCTLPITSLRTIDLLVTELAVIAFGDRARLLETAPGVSVEEVLAATDAELVVTGNIPEMAL